MIHHFFDSTNIMIHHFFDSTCVYDDIMIHFVDLTNIALLNQILIKGCHLLILFFFFFFYVLHLLNEKAKFSTGPKSLSHNDIFEIYCLN